MVARKYCKQAEQHIFIHWISTATTASEQHNLALFYTSQTSLQRHAVSNFPASRYTIAKRLRDMKFSKVAFILKTLSHPDELTSHLTKRSKACAKSLVNKKHERHEIKQ